MSVVGILSSSLANSVLPSSAPTTNQNTTNQNFQTELQQLARTSRRAYSSLQQMRRSCRFLQFHLYLYLRLYSVNSPSDQFFGPSEPACQGRPACCGRGIVYPELREGLR